MVVSLGTRRFLSALGLLAAVAVGLGGRDPTESLLSPAIASASSKWAACPLTPVQEKVAVLAFEEMMPVIRHPRCFNCHGGVNPFVPYAKGGHFGNAAIDTVNGQIQPTDCQQCHGGLPGWDVPGQALHFVGKTSRELCIQFKSFFPKAPDLFVEHIEHEPGLPQFIKTAFKGDRGLDDAAKDARIDDFPSIPFVVQPPPGTLADLVAQATAWGTAIARPGGWTPSPECGCEIRKKGWVGTVTAHARIDPWNEGVLEEKATATILFEYVTPPDPDTNPAEEYKATMGSISWHVTATGRCTGDFAGTTPLPAGFEPANLPRLRLEPRASSVRYSVSVGPWLSMYSPVRSFTCANSPPQPAVQPQFAVNWWRSPLGGVLGLNAEHLDGAYTMRVKGGFVAWQWSFSLNEPP